MKRQEIEKLLRIFQRSEKIKKDIFKEKLIEYLLQTHITVEEMDEVSKLLKTC